MMGNRLFAWIILTGALVLSAFAVFMRVDNRIERWVHPTDAEAARYRDFRDTFGSDEFILIAYRGDGLFSEEALDAQVAALAAAETVAGVEHADGIPAVYRDRFGLEDAEALAEEFTATPFYKGFLINEHADVAALLVDVTPPPTAEGRRSLVEDLRAAAQPLRDFGFQVHMAGPPLLNAVLDTASQAEAARTFPPALLISLVVLLWLFRSWRAVVAAAGCGALTVTATLGAMGAAGKSMTMVTSALPALLWVIALAASVHVISRYRVHRGAGATLDDALARTLAEVGRPCVLAGVTTAAGFLALCLADLGPVRELGQFAALGVVISMVLALWVCPLFLRLLRVDGVATKAERVSGWTHRLAHLVVQRKRALVLGSAGLALACLAVLPRISVESDPLTFLPQEGKTAEDFAFIGENLTGFYSLEVVTSLGVSWAQPDQWPALDALANEIAALPGVARVLAPLDVLRKLRQWDAGLDPEAYALPANAEDTRALLENLDADGHAVLSRFVDDTGQRVRLSVLINEMNSADFNRIVSGVEEALGRLPDSMHGYATGIVRQLVESQLALVHTQVRSFAVALLAIVLCMGIGLRSVHMALLSIAPNVLPVLAALALMALLGVPLDPGTVMVASVALGIAVDDTAHVLAGIQRMRRENKPPGEAVTLTLVERGPALVVTTLTACAGFAALWRSQFVPIAWFGLFSAVALTVALAADLLLTPALYLLFAQRERLR